MTFLPHRPEAPGMSGLGKGALKYEVKKQNDNEGNTH
jgi:hypothetical protein